MSNYLHFFVTSGVRENLLTYFFGGNKPATCAQLTELTGLTRSAIWRELQRLEHHGFLAKKRRGHQVFYSANPKCPIALELIKIVNTPAQ